MIYGNMNNHGTQDWQVEAYERQDKINPFIRHQRAIIDVENTTYYSGINMSKRGRTYGK
jgi:hypothetical protein